MSDTGISRIKEKLQELGNIIKEEMTVSSQEIKDDLLHNVNDMKKVVEERYKEIEEKSKSAQKGYSEIINDLEAKALKVQYTIQDKYSQGVEKKDNIVTKTAESLVESIIKAKDVLVSKDNQEK